MLLIFLNLFIVSNALSKGKNISILYNKASFVGYIIILLFTHLIVDWYFFTKNISLFNGLIYITSSNIIFINFLFLLSFFITILTSYTNEIKEESKTTSLGSNVINETIEKINGSLQEILQVSRQHLRIPEYALILQFILFGGITLLSSNDLITIFLSIELQSYGLYILSTIYRNSESSTNAGLTYFLLGGLSSCIILLGLSFLYINSGTTGLDGLYLINNIITSNDNLLSYFLSIHQETSNYLPIYTLSLYQYTIQFSLTVLCVGFLFKISAAPFHSWSPGVYDSIPTVTTTFVAIIPKISILILLFDLVYCTWHTTLDYSWTNILLFSSLLSLIIGSIVGLTQSRIKRLYAYSTISHVGFILLALSVHSVESIQAFFFYIIQYSLSNLNAFFVLILIGYTYVNYNKKTKGYVSILSTFKEYKNKIQELSPIQYIDQLKGYFYLNPLLAISLAITLYSFIGVPPLVGFFGKQMVLSSALDNGYIFICLIAILTSVISAVYYLYIVKHLFFEKSKYILDDLLINLIHVQIKGLNPNKLETNKNTITSSSWLTCSISILSLIMLLFIFLYSEIYLLMNILSILIVY